MTPFLRLCTEADIESADALLVAAYEFPRSIKRMLSHYYFPIQPDGWWLALVDGQPVGFGGAVDYGTCSSLGMLAVHPEWQQRGIGEALVRQIITWCEARKSPSLILEAAPRAVSLYARLGFTPEETTLQMSCQQPPTALLPALNVATMQERDLSEVASFDTPYFGADRTKVLLPHWQDHPERAFVLRDETGQITGYLFARLRIIGPWIAHTVQDAEQLLCRALTLPFEGNPEVSIPAQNQAGVALLKRYGFSEEEDDITHFMRRGFPFPGQRAMIYAQASPALG